MVAGGFMPRSAIKEASVASVPAGSPDRAGGPADGHRGVSGERPAAISARAISANAGEPHEDDQRAGLSDSAPIDRFGRMAADESHRRSMFAMRQRDAGVGGEAEGRGDAGDDFEGNAGLGQRFGLLTAAAEQEWVAALEPDHGEPAARALDEHGGDFILGKSVRRFLLTDVEAFGGGWREIKQRGGRQVIEEHGVGLGEEAAAFDGDQLGIAGAGADEIDFTGHGSLRL